MIVYFSGSGFMCDRGCEEAEDLLNCSVMLSFWDIKQDRKRQRERVDRIGKRREPVGENILLGKCL